ncbi:MAG TPA: glycosyl hydrolase family 8, partial [Polyangiaceae bacterium]|nr:glycosyl hydrolase family 8 [Polyangiaceae bacterium]
MTPILRARRRGGPVCLSAVALLSLACGVSGDGSDPVVPAFAGSATAPGAEPAALPPAEEANAPAEMPPAVPGATAAPTSRGEGPDEGISLAPMSPVEGTDEPGSDSPAATPEMPAAPDATPPEQPGQPEQPAPASPDRPTRGTTNLFTDLLGIPVAEVDDRVRLVVNRLFGIGTNESAIPQANTGYRIYYQLPQDPSQAFIWCADANDVRSEGQSYGMMIAVQMNMQAEFDRLWRFAQQRMQFATNDAWNRYFRWQGQVTANANQINVNFGQNGPAPDGDEYFAAALYLADRRWGSNGAINYEQEADAIASAMLNNAGGGQGRVPIINAQSNMVVFFPQGNSAGFSDPSYHLPAFYELFAQDGNPGDAARWRQLAEVSRQYFVRAANGNTGLHPDYANFDGSPNA